jgi:hypothetical protein
MNYKIILTIMVISFLSITGSAAAVALHLAAAIPVAEDTIENWADNYPRAASELGEWVNVHRDAARELFKWDSSHPEQSKAFVTWVITHQGKGIDAFTAQYTDWTRFSDIIKGHRPAVCAFIVWCRFHPKASAALMQHPRALHWVGRHLYESSLKGKGD